jgi:hypothetical protein
LRKLERLRSAPLDGEEPTVSSLRDAP